MIGKVCFNGKTINAIVIDTEAVELREIRNSLIEVLKAAVIHPDHVLTGEEIWCALDVIKATFPEEGGDCGTVS